MSEDHELNLEEIQEIILAVTDHPNADHWQTGNLGCALGVLAGTLVGMLPGDKVAFRGAIIGIMDASIPLAEQGVMALLGSFAPGTDTKQ